MNVPTASALERALLRSGDDFYRLALLLSADQASAEATLVKAIRQLSSASTAPDDQALLTALVAALPSERRRARRAPDWALPPKHQASQAPLLLAIARLPRLGRLALGLNILHELDAIQAAPLPTDEHGSVEQLLHTSMLTLAPIAAPDLATDTLDPALVAADCRPARTAIVHNDLRLHSEPALRGHLALCAACRTAEQNWLKLSGTVEQTLRGALRERRLPAALHEQLLAAAQTSTAAPRGHLLDDLRVRLALVTLPVLAAIAFLVWPRGVAPSASGSDTTAASAAALGDLVNRASAQLYTPPQGAGVWHSRYEIQWMLPNSAFAPLVADQWVEPASGAHRTQLVHRSGGGPYEFELADATGSAWYAISPTYLPSIYPLSANPLLLRVQLQATPEQQRQLLQARLDSGAWGIASAYLRQAQAAELHSWGRQRDLNGAPLVLISFSGVSPLKLPPDAPNATTSQVTILLAIDENTGHLREVRELLGAAGSEQTTRTTWRMVSDEWVSDATAINRVFNLRQAWNGVGDFTNNGALRIPQVPLAGTNTIMPLALLPTQYWTVIWLPSAPPPDTTAAALLSSDIAPINRDALDPRVPLTFVYTGNGRRLEISTVMDNGSETPLADGESITLGRETIALEATAAQGYRAHILHNNPLTLSYLTKVEASGYTRAEFLAVLKTIGPPTLDSYRAQAQLFVNPPQHYASAFEALLQALAAVPAGIHHTSERVFQRQLRAADPLADPYHRPRYNGWPELVLRDSWNRGEVANNTFERATLIRDDHGSRYAQTYLSTTTSWNYAAPTSELAQHFDFMISTPQSAPEYQNIILRMLACGGATLESHPSGTKTIRLIEQNWRNGESCMHPEYASLFYQQDSNDANFDPYQAPFLADQTSNDLSTLIHLDAAGHATRIETWAGAPTDGTLLESIDLLSDEIVPAAQLRDPVFSAQPPDALIKSVSSLAVPPTNALIRTLSLEEAQKLSQARLFTLPITVTTDLIFTDTTELTPHLTQLIGKALPQTGSGFITYNQDTPFDLAVRQGYAVQFSYRLDHSETAPIHNLYQGPAHLFAASLRANALWQSSSTTTIHIGENQVPAWQVRSRQNDHTWLIFQLDDTLIAAQDPNPELLAALRQLRPAAT